MLTSGGVGYQVNVNGASADKWKIDSEAEVQTYLVVRENALELYGFASLGERELFLKFLTVSGIGPKTAIHLLSLGSVGEISGAIGRGDLDYLTKVSGIGKKTAERIVVELRSKLQAMAVEATDKSMEANGGPVADAIDALISLGYSALEARDVVKKIDAAGKSSEQLLKEALRMIK